QVEGGWGTVWQYRPRWWKAAVVDVDRAPAHAADVESQGGPDEIGGPFCIVADDDGQRPAQDVEGLRGLPGAGAGEALGQGAGVEVVHGRREEDHVPAVGDLGRQGHVLRSFRAQVDRDLGAVRVPERAERLAPGGY